MAVNAANAARAVPSLALLTLFAIIPAISLTWGGFLAAFLALVILAIPPILTNTYVGIREVDTDVRDAASAMGLTGGQVLRRVELPLAVPVLMAGVRTASIEVVATSTLAAYVSFSDLGTPIIAGLNTNNTVRGLRRRAAGGRPGRPGGVRPGRRAEGAHPDAAAPTPVRGLTRPPRGTVPVMAETPTA